MVKTKHNPQDLMCGITGWRPSWLQQFATARSFLVGFGLLGTIQTMAFLYFTITLTTLEKRFKIPSYSTGIVLSGNEVSQILLSLTLSYFGGQRNRPKWIAWGGIISGISCFILALAHTFFGPGESAIKLTREYMYRNELDSNLLLNLTVSPKLKSAHKLCIDTPDLPEEQQEFMLAPLILIFVSQFVLGVGTTLYYTLGSTYLDDGTAKKQTPMMLAYAMSFRIIGLIFGFGLVAGTMNVYIDPWSTPLIDSKDPRWLGAWWLGWYILGFAMVVSSLFIGLFPRVLPKKLTKIQMQVIRDEKSKHFEEDKPLRALSIISEATEDNSTKDDTFMLALKRLLTNKLVMFNTIGSIFYILGASAFMTYYSKYLEVQFNKNAAESSLMTGPATIVSMVSGILFSGYIISKYQPAPKKLFFFNVIVGMAYMCGQFNNIFMYCDAGSFHNENGLVNLTTTCNMDCACTGVPYSPVCDVSSGTTFFSPCHAGCKSWSDAERKYTQCGCSKNTSDFTQSPWSLSTSTLRPDGGSIRIIAESQIATTRTIEETTDSLRPNEDSIQAFTKSQISTTSNDEGTTSTLRPVVEDSIRTVDETSDEYYEDEYNDDDEAETKTRDKRSFETSNSSMIPGVCLASCGYAFFTYTLISCIINWTGSAARIGNLLVNFRAVPVRDKSFAQGFTLFMISLFAMIPGPIIYGYIIDSTCVIWNDNNGSLGNCQMYDQKRFRHLVNFTAMGFTAIGTGFDLLVWWHGRHMELYNDEDETVVKSSDGNANPPKC